MLDKKIGSRVMFWIGDTKHFHEKAKQSIFSQINDKHICMMTLKIETFRAFDLDFFIMTMVFYHWRLINGFKRHSKLYVSASKVFVWFTHCKKIYTEHLLSTISGGTALAAGFINGNKDNIKKWWSKLFLQN